MSGVGDDKMDSNTEFIIEFTRRLVAGQIADDYKLTPQELWDLYEK